MGKQDNHNAGKDNREVLSSKSYLVDSENDPTQRRCAQLVFVATDH